VGVVYHIFSQTSFSMANLNFIIQCFVGEVMHLMDGEIGYQKQFLALCNIGGLVDHMESRNLHLVRG
jgi:hypothetical protein